MTVDDIILPYIVKKVTLFLFYSIFSSLLVAWSKTRVWMRLVEGRFTFWSFGQLRSKYLVSYALLVFSVKTLKLKSNTTKPNEWCLFIFLKFFICNTIS